MQTLTGSQQALVADFTALVDGRTGLERQAVFTRLRAELPMFRSDRLDAWVVSRHADIKTVLNSENLYQPPQAGAGAPPEGYSKTTLAIPNGFPLGTIMRINQWASRHVLTAVIASHFRVKAARPNISVGAFHQAHP